ncbi:MAG: hypothetical protein Q7R70_01135 [Candidatus Diapherotrites archaeon]|nr:hypothetical protein [Candidatus Diapherotrites archaeon]
MVSKKLKVLIVLIIFAAVMLSYFYYVGEREKEQFNKLSALISSNQKLEAVVSLVLLVTKLDQVRFDANLADSNLFSECSEANRLGMQECNKKCKVGRTPDGVLACSNDCYVPVGEKFYECIGRPEVNVQLRECRSDYLKCVDNFSPNNDIKESCKAAAISLHDFSGAFLKSNSIFLGASVTISQIASFGGASESDAWKVSSKEQTLLADCISKIQKIKKPSNVQ